MQRALAIQEFIDRPHIEEVFHTLQAGLVHFAFKLVLVIVTATVGIRLAKFLRRSTRQAMKRSNIDATLTTFITNLVYFGFLVLLGIIILEELGVEGTAILAALTSSLFAVGLAIQGSLGNFAAGVLIIIFRPFRLGDYIEADGLEGYVDTIHILTTTLRTYQKSYIIIPNSHLTNDHIVNHSKNPFRRVDMIFRVSYEDDIDHVKSVALDVLAAEPLILSDPPPFVGVRELTETAVNFAVRGYAESDLYWEAWFAIHEQMKKRFDAEGITIPFPQQDVRLINAEPKP